MWSNPNNTGCITNAWTHNNTPHYTLHLFDQSEVTEYKYKCQKDQNAVALIWGNADLNHQFQTVQNGSFMKKMHEWRTVFFSFIKFPTDCKLDYLRLIYQGVIQVIGQPWPRHVAGSVRWFVFFLGQNLLQYFLLFYICPKLPVDTHICIQTTSTKINMYSFSHLWIEHCYCYTTEVFHMQFFFRRERHF